MDVLVDKLSDFRIGVISHALKNPPDNPGESLFLDAACAVTNVALLIAGFAARLTATALRPDSLFCHCKYLRRSQCNC